MTEKAKVAIVGLGRIGSGYDETTDASDAQPPRSHVAAVLRNSDLELAAVCDTDAALIKRFQRARRLSVKTYTSLPAMLAAGRYDIITIATPAETHEAVALACLAPASPPHALFCEKPLGTSAASAERILDAVRKASVALAVNYHRRWDDRIAQLRREISTAGGARHANFLYVKELRNYGAHAIDLLRQLFGEVAAVQTLAMTTRLNFADGFEACLTALDGLDYEVFDLDVLCKSARLRIIFGGQQMWRSHPHPNRFFPGYTVLGEETRVVPDAPVHGLVQAYAELAHCVITGAKANTSTGENAVAVHRIIEAIEQSAVTGAVVSP